MCCEEFRDSDFDSKAILKRIYIILLFALLYYENVVHCKDFMIIGAD